MMNKFFNLVFRPTKQAGGTPLDGPEQELPDCIEARARQESAADIDADYDAFIWDMSRELEDDPEIKDLIGRYEQDLAVQAHPFSLGRALRGMFIGGWVRPLSAVAASLVIIVASYIYLSSPVLTLHETEVGVQKIVKLADHSVVTLNTNSAVRIAYDDHSRTIYLKRGEAIFTVAKDKNRPFYVHTGAGIVRAIGTEFNILIDPDNRSKVTVSVLEGKVSINDELSSYPRVILPILSSGEEVSLAQKLSPDDVNSLDISRISGWRTGQIIFRDIYLQDAIRDHNRYSDIKIVLNDQTFAHRKISGTFQIGDTDALMFALKNLLDIVVERRDGKLLILKGDV